MSARAPPRVESAARWAFTRTMACVTPSLYRPGAVRYAGQHPKRASVSGAGSFGTAVAVLLVRAGMRTTLLCRTREQAEEMALRRENERYLPGVQLTEALQEIVRQGVSPRAGLVSLAKGLVPPDGVPPTVALEAHFGPERVACVGGPAHAREMVDEGA